MDKTDIKTKDQKSKTKTQSLKIEKKTIANKTVDIKKEDKKQDMKKLDKKLAKIITGTVVSVKMEKTVVVSYTRKVAHKRYGKLMKVTKKIKADTNGMELSLGDTVKIEQTKPISKDKFFKVIKKEEIGK